MKTLDERFWEKVNKTSNCWEWTGATSSGYGVIGAGKRVDGILLVHRVSYSLAYGSIPDGLFVCHTCDNRICVNPNHLFLGTCKANLEDMVNKGRSTVGERNARSKISQLHVHLVRLLYFESSLTQAEIAKRIDVCVASVNHIVKGKTWTHIGARI